MIPPITIISSPFVPSMSHPPPPLTQSNAPLRQSLSTNANPLPPPTKTLTGIPAASVSLQRPVSARVTSSSVPPEAATAKAGFMRPLTAIPQAKGAVVRFKISEIQTANYQPQFNNHPDILPKVHNICSVFQRTCPHQTVLVARCHVLHCHVPVWSFCGGCVVSWYCIFSR